MPGDRSERRADKRVSERATRPGIPLAGNEKGGDCAMAKGLMERKGGGGPGVAILSLEKKLGGPCFPRSPRAGHRKGST